MNLRHPKVIRLGGLGAAFTTLLAAAAGGYLALTFFQGGDALSGGIAAGLAAAVGLLGSLCAYCLFAFARMQPAPAEAPAAIASETEAAVAVVETAGDEDEAIAISVANSTSPPPELSDDAIPVFASQTNIADDSVADLLVVPPPIDALDDSDSISVERSVSGEDFDSRMDLPVTIDPPELDVEELDVVPPTVVQAQTNPVVSALTQTDEVDALDELGNVTPEAELPKPAPSVARPSLPDAFPDIFKSAMPKAATAVSAAPIAPAPPKPAAAPAPKMAPAAVAKPATPAKPAAPKPAKVDNADDESLPVVDDLDDIAITLGPVTPTGVLPTEIPDFFLKMPTGRSTPPTPAKPAMPVAPIAPVAPRQVAAPKPAHHAEAVVRIIDSTTVAETGDELVTMTAIPDDWPS